MSPASTEEIRSKLRQDAYAIFRAGVDAVAPEAALRRHLHRDGTTLHIDGEAYDLATGRNYVIAFGKAAVAMAATLESILDDALTAGIAVTKYGHSGGARLQRIELLEASHPVPDESGVEAARRIVAMAEGAKRGDLVLVAISGGGSALLALPAEGLSLADKQSTTNLLLRAGATIQELNTIRKQLSAIKGGRLATAIAPARCISLVISDVVGDPLDFIASGPTVPDTTTFADAHAICERFDLLYRLPGGVRAYLQGGRRGEVPESPKPGDPRFRGHRTYIVANLHQALEAAQQHAVELGYNSVILTSHLQGEAREAAKVFAAIARDVRHNGQPLASPACLLSGGETTVTVRGDGKGGRNQEFALAALADLAGVRCAVLLSAGTDGTDGPTDAAGAVVDDTSLQRASEAGLDWRAALANNDAYPFLQRLGDLLITGPTQTNVMDIQILLVESCST